MRSRFTTPDNLASQVGTDLGKWISEHKPELKKPFTVPTPPTPYFAHPYPMQRNFTGREQERTELTDWLVNDPCPIFACIAIGGMGKSALTWHWLHEDVLKEGSPPEGVIWWSFYDKEAGFERFMDHAIAYASSGKTNPKDIPSSRDRMDALYNFLSQHRFLLVFDGVERVLRAYAGMGSPYQGDEVKEDERGDYRSCIDPHCSTFLQMLASVPKTKILLTSRLFPKELDELEGCLRKDLTQMDKDDAVEFFKLQGVKGTRAEIEEVCNAYGYHPLSLRLLSGMIVNDMKYNGDIKAWTKYNPLPDLKGTKKEHHILDLAYNSLDKKKQAFITKLAAFRNPMGYDAILIFNDFGSEENFNDVLVELTERGLLFRDEKSRKFDLHPIVRRYCYDRLTDKEGVHSQLIDYFAYIPTPEKIESVDDLAPVMELYHHTVRAGRYTEAEVLYYDRLGLLYYKFGEYQTIIELLRALFPDGENKLPALDTDDKKAFTLNALATSYALSGQPRRAIRLLEKFKNIYEVVMKNKDHLAIGLVNLALNLIRVGELDAAEANLQRSIEICHEIKSEFDEAVGHQFLGHLLFYRGNFNESENELARALESFTKLNAPQSQSVVWAYRSIRALLMSNPEEALKSAKKARELADVENVKRDVILAEWLIGAAYLMKEKLTEAEKHVTEALTRDRKINMVDLEPDILLEFAKLWFQQNHKEAALKQAEEALQIADRCEYQLKQADIHNFLAEFYMDADELEKAKEHAEKAEERAECGYVPALEKAEKLLKEIEQRSN